MCPKKSSLVNFISRDKIKLMIDEELFRDAKKLYLFLSDCKEIEPDFQHADILLAAGSHDLRTAEYAAELFNNQTADWLICSGGFGKTTHNWNKPEGIVYAEKCISLGVPKSKIIIETESKNSGENIINSRKILQEKGIVPKTGIIVHKPYMAKRIWATAIKQWSSVKWAVKVPLINFEDYPSKETPLETMVNLMIGDLQRLKIYAEKGFQASVEIPPEIWEVYERLVKKGYNQFVIS